MPKLLSIALFLSISIQSWAQNLYLNDQTLASLNAKIALLEDKYEKSTFQTLKSFPQTTGSYFEIITQNPTIFLAALEKSKDFKQLVDSFPNLLIDKDMLVIKNVYLDYNKKRKIDISSFGIGNGGDHRISLNYTDSLDKDDLKYFYVSYTCKGKTTVSGFYLDKNFKATEIPGEYADWINYNDVLIEPEKPIFLLKPKSQFERLKFKPDVFDTLNNYFNIHTNKPKCAYGSNDKLSLQKMEKWESQHKKFADSLYQNDTKFKEILNNALGYADKNSVSNEGSETCLGNISETNKPKST